MRDRHSQIPLRNRGWQLVRDAISRCDGDPDSISRDFAERNHDAYEKVAMLSFLMEEVGRYPDVPELDMLIKSMIRQRM